MITQKSQSPNLHRKPGGQPGHIGKTRKGFARVDRYEISTPDSCEHCGSRELSDIIGYSKQQVACLVDRPIEVVEYQRAKCQCNECGTIVIGLVSPGGYSARTRFEYRSTSMIGMAR